MALSPQERESLRLAIRRAEAGTSGEIVCVVARRSDDYFFPAAVCALFFLLLASLGAAFLLERWWIAPRLPVFAAAAMLAGLSILGLLKLLPALRLHLTPRAVRFRAAHAEAVKQFLARNVHVTSARTGVLVFVSLAERYAEVLADSGIDSRVPENTWAGLIERLTAAAAGGRLGAGLEAAVGEVGAHLAAHFPPGAENPNELPDHLVELG
jgi:putative membrane protein